MPRALTAERSAVPAGDREAHLARLRRRRDFYRGAGCRYWVFEAIERPGAFIEFVEAEDAHRLRSVLAAAPDRDDGPALVYQELELD